MAYRDRREAPRGKHARSAPVLQELVRQFSDRYAFLRELVQNSIDAGATRVRVTVSRDGDRRTTSFEDDGSGMTLDVIKGPFLTKFASSKEGDRSKIGRYGVGFLSVFALDPELVVVDTETADAAYSIRLDPSFAFEVSKAPVMARSGTRVTLVERSAGDDAEHLVSIERALTRWCRHAAVVVDLVVDGVERRLNEPFSLAACVSVEESVDGLRVLVGPAHGAGGEQAAFAGFYSRGLTLIEATAGDHVVSGIRYKVESPDLSHTISRDDVVRNRAYERALTIVRRLAERPLRAALAREIAASARRSAESGIVEAAYPTLVEAAHGKLSVEHIVVPLVEPFEGERVVSLGALRSLKHPRALAHAEAPSLLTAELRERRAAVVLASGGSASWLGKPSRSAEEVVRLVPARRVDEGDAFGVPLLRALAGLGLEVGTLLIADAQDVEGRSARLLPASTLTLLGSGAANVFLPARDDGTSADTLLLFSGEPALSAALSRLHPARAALLVARLVWLEERGELTRRANLGLLDASLGHWGAPES